MTRRTYSRVGRYRRHNNYWALDAMETTDKQLLVVWTLFALLYAAGLCNRNFACQTRGHLNFCKLVSIVYEATNSHLEPIYIAISMRIYTEQIWNSLESFASKIFLLINNIEVHLLTKAHCNDAAIWRKTDWINSLRIESSNRDLSLQLIKDCNYWSSSIAFFIYKSTQMNVTQSVLIWGFPNWSAFLEIYSQTRFILLGSFSPKNYS